MLTVLGSARPRLSLGKVVSWPRRRLRGPQRRSEGIQTPEAGVGTVRPLLDQHLAAGVFGALPRMPRRTWTPRAMGRRFHPEVALISPEGRAGTCLVTPGGPWACVCDQDSLPTLTPDRSFSVTLESVIGIHPA